MTIRISSSPRFALVDVGARGVRPIVREAAVDHLTSRWLAIVIFGLTFVGTVYNGGLAVVNAHGHLINTTAVAACEILILGIGAASVVLSRVRPSDFVPFLMLIIIVLISLMLSLENDHIWVDEIRNFGIIAIFTMLGARTPLPLLSRVFLCTSFAVFVVLLIEVVRVNLYVAIFQPAMYASSARGVADFSLNTTGLYAGALGFGSRFSYGIFSGARTSSLFLEQVSLATYSVVLSIYLIGAWRWVPVWHRIFHVLLVLFIITSNNTRAASILVAVFVPGYFIFPLIPKYLNALLPFFILGTAIAFVEYKTGGIHYVMSDDLLGRLSLTIYNLSELTSGAIIGGDIGNALHYMDSGYMYVIASSTFAGGILLWTYVSFSVPQTRACQKRSAWALALYVFVWLSIGGTAIFTIKTAALLWLTVGHFRREEYRQVRTHNHASPVSYRAREHMEREAAEAGALLS